MRIKINKIYLWLPVLFIVSSCYKAPEGCTDPNALNYDVVADVSCDNNCCNYPSVYIDFSFVYNDTISVDTNTFFTNAVHDTFRITYLKLFLSDFTFAGDKDTIPVKNIITLGFAGDDDIRYDNINCSAVKININKKFYNSGTIEKRALFNNMYFIFGLNKTVNHAADISRLNSSFALYQNADSMYIDSYRGFYFLKMTLENTKKEKRNISIYGDENKVEFVLKGNYDFSERENHTVHLRLDVKKWFEDTDIFGEKDKETIKKLIKNLKKSIKIL